MGIRRLPKSGELRKRGGTARWPLSPFLELRGGWKKGRKKKMRKAKWRKKTKNKKSKTKKTKEPLLSGYLTNLAKKKKTTKKKRAVAWSPPEGAPL